MRVSLPRYHTSKKSPKYAHRSVAKTSEHYIQLFSGKTTLVIISIKNVN